MKFLDIENYYDTCVVFSTAKSDTAYSLSNIGISNNGPSSLSIFDFAVSLTLGFIIANFYDRKHNLIIETTQPLDKEVCNRYTFATPAIGSGQSIFEKKWRSFLRAFSFLSSFSLISYGCFSFSFFSLFF